MASAAEEVTAGIDGVNASLGEVNRLVETVSAAVDLLTDSFQGICRLCAEAGERSGKADQITRDTVGVMIQLSNAAREIGDVVILINDISEQTNMLALNAFIEAAGAGANGAGFAVVAGEVKDLARQTAIATQSIADKIDTIQINTKDASESVERGLAMIGAIAKANDDILHAVRRQQDSVNEIATSMTGVSNAADAVTARAIEIGMVVQESAESAEDAAAGTDTIVRATSRAVEQARALAEKGVDMEKQLDVIAQASANVLDITKEVQEKMTTIDQATMRIKEQTTATIRLADEVTEIGAHPLPEWR